jgi:hypothetical protein
MSKGIASPRNAMNLAAAAGIAAIALAIAAAPWRAPNAAPSGPEAGLGEARYQIDAARGRLWTLTREGVVVTDADGGHKTELRLPEWQWAAPPYGCPPDIALGPSGEVVITSNALAALWRIDPETLAVSVHPLALDADTDKDVGFSRLVYSPRQGAYLAVADHHGSLWKIDAQLTSAQKILEAGRVADPCLLPARLRTGRLSANRAPCPGGAHPFVAARGC